MPNPLEGLNNEASISFEKIRDKSGWGKKVDRLFVNPIISHEMGENKTATKEDVIIFLDKLLIHDDLKLAIANVIKNRSENLKEALVLIGKHAYPDIDKDK
jgi:hypothetical protein